MEQADGIAAKGREVEEAHPPIIAKLRFVRDDTKSWFLKPGFLGQKDALPFQYLDTNNDKNRAGAAMPVEPGQTFFDDGPAKGRFRYIQAVKRKQLNPAINIEEIVAIARVEDLKSNKAGKVYEIPAPLKRGEINQYIQYDRSAVLVLEALGQGGKQAMIEENTHFSLPFGEDRKPYLLKLVSPDYVIIEYSTPDDRRAEVKIMKGQLASHK